MKREDAGVLSRDEATLVPGAEPTARDFIAFLDALQARIEIDMPGLYGVVEREADKWVSYVRTPTRATFHECETMHEGLVHLMRDCL